MKTKYDSSLVSFSVLTVVLMWLGDALHVPAMTHVGMGMGIMLWAWSAVYVARTYLLRRAAK